MNATDTQSSKLVPAARHRATSRRLGVAAGVLVGAYAVLLIPPADPQIPPATASGMTNFVWNQDEVWRDLEVQMLSARELTPSALSAEAGALHAKIEAMLDQLERETFQPDASIFRDLETSMFRLAALAGAAPEMADRLATTLFHLRAAVKEHSRRGQWDLNSFAARSCIYRLLFGARAALDEALAQREIRLVGALQAADAPSGTAATELRLLDGTLLRIHSGDLLLSRGDAPTSAFIARGNDFPGNFSHVALAHVNPATRELHIIESLIHHGLVVTRPAEYASNKLRVAVLRLRADHPMLLPESDLPHRAAARLLQRARGERVAYDFEMNWRDPKKLFCSEVAATAYAAQGVNLWMGMSHISSAGLKRWLTGFGVRHFETQEPSDLEYDPQLVLVAEWRGDIRQDRADNAVIDAMLETAEQGRQLDYPRWKLPLARAAKAASAAANLFHYEGKIPEGMDAAGALRQLTLTERHTKLKSELRDRAERFRVERGYAPPYWELLRLARESAAVQ